YNSPRLSCPVHTANCQARVIDTHSLCSHEHCVHPRTKRMRMMASSKSSDPSRLAKSTRQSAIEGHAAFGDHEWASCHNPFVISLIDSLALFRQDSFPHCDACFSQLDDASTAVPWIYVRRPYDYVSDSSPDDGIRARASAPDRRTRLQSNVERR